MFRVQLLWAMGALLVLALPIAIPVSGREWFVNYTATDTFPEEGVFTRHIWKGGAVRTLKDGILTLDTLHDPDAEDYYTYIRLGEMDPNGPGEVLVVEWRLFVEKVDGEYGASVGVFGDDDGAIGFNISRDRVLNPFDGTLDLSIESGRFHWFRLETADMIWYRLYVDAELRHVGRVWRPGFGESRLAWGEGIQGYGALEHWDFLRAGVLRRHGPGDLTCDDRVDFADINPFVMALGSPELYMNEYPKCDWKNADCNTDGHVDFRDINPFVELLTKIGVNF